MIASSLMYIATNGFYGSPSLTHQLYPLFIEKIPSCVVISFIGLLTWSQLYHAGHEKSSPGHQITGGNNGASLADLMGHESVEITKAFYAIFEQGDLRRKHDQFSGARWG